MSPEQYLQTGTTLTWLLTTAWLLPLLGFIVEVFGGRWGTRTSKSAAYLAVGCIGTGFLLCLIALVVWIRADGVTLFAAAPAHHAAEEHPAADTHAEATPATGHETHTVNNPLKTAFTGKFYRLAKFGRLDISLDYYIDGLTVIMFAMVTLIATCIHVFAIGYMSDELTDNYEDHQVHLHGGGHFHRPGRFYRFFSFLSLFCFAMLGLVLAGNIFQIFIFWELVGVCSYLLIGFYVERHTASTAANKAFIMNRVGDFGFLVGLMILWTWFGVFQFANTNPLYPTENGLFQMARTPAGELVTEGAGAERVIRLQATSTPVESVTGYALLNAVDPPEITVTNEMLPTMPYWLLTVAGLGIFAGCVGKSAQFPLQTWLPDAMEGPTPVSALVHSATMVAAGVYLVGRFYPMFTPEVLLVIAYTGCITLFIGATIALVVTDIKKVLAYSTISQLGYMMLALGVGGWMAGLFHLITHAFFKSLMFLCSGSVIHGCHHEQDLTRMGGLHKRMPITCWTMFVGVIAICGLAVPLIPLPWFGPIAFSGFHSKDSILATALSFADLNPEHALLFIVPLITAGLTAFYMFRMWFMTFFGEPKVHHVYEHAHESPRIMTRPLLVLAFFAMFIGAAGENGPLVRMLHTAEPSHIEWGVTLAEGIIEFPNRVQIHDHHLLAGAAALTVAFAGALLAYLFYAIGRVDAGAVARQFRSTYEFLIEKWRFDTLYDVMCVWPVHVIASWAQAFDKYVLDAFVAWLAKGVVQIAYWDRRFDETVVDKAVNILGDGTYSLGEAFRHLQTGKLRQYVTFIAVSVVALFMLLFILIPGR